MDSIILIVPIVLIAGLYLAFNIGANDVANTVGTSVGSRALSIKQAIIAAGICEFAGAFLIGDQVTKTIKQGFVNPSIFAADPMGFAYGMTAAILATSFWLQYATVRGLPVSTTHSIVGAVLGFAIIQGGFFDIKYYQLLAIFSSWLFSPVLGALISYATLRLILHFIIDTKEPMRRVRFLVPPMIGFTVTILSLAFTSKILSNKIWGLLLAIFLGLIVSLIFLYFSAKIVIKPNHRKLQLYNTESIFARMQFVTACFLAFAHGSNDVANAIGPASAVISAVTTNNVADDTAVPTWLLLIGAFGIVLGLTVFGRKVIQTVGKQITEITPTRGFAAEFGAAFTILLGTIMGLPLSTTHVLVGSVVGVGLARGISGVDLTVIKKIGRSWIITMPATALISMFFCWLLKQI